MDETETTTLSTTQRSFAVVDVLREQNGAGITEIAAQLGISKGTAYNHVATLREEDFVTKEDGEYHLTLQFSKLGEFVRNRKPEFGNARELATELAEVTGFNSSFVVEENGRGTYLCSEPSEMSGENLRPQVGDRMFLHSTAAGKAILSQLPESRVDAICDRVGLPELTPNTITDRETLDRELERIREQGYAFNRGENQRGIRAVSVPVVLEGSVVGAAGVAGSNYQVDDEWFEEEFAGQVSAIVESAVSDW